MSGFSYRDGVLCAEDAPLPALASEIGTPAYVYSTAGLKANWRRFETALTQRGIAISYAVKANSNLAIIRTLAGFGAGADVVSEGEMRRALAAGVPPERIVFSGVGKKREELAAALAAGIHQINVESVAELDLLSAVAVEAGATAPVAIRINPDVDARTHAKITTGRKGDKFGVDLDMAVEAFRHARSLPGIDPLGVAVHLGSQLLDLDPYRSAYRKLAELVRALRADGFDIRRVDLGGGMGVTYREETPLDLETYGALVEAEMAPLGVDLMVEPGRALVAEAGMLLARTIFVKEGSGHRFLILDAAMNDLIRPALYDAWHDILPVAEPAAGAAMTPYDVVGPVCESGDTFARQRALPPMRAGDLVAFAGAGAYSAVMASEYNSRPLAPEVLVDGNRFAVVRKRPTFEEMIELEAMPPWF